MLEKAGAFWRTLTQVHRWSSSLCNLEGVLLALPGEHVRVGLQSVVAWPVKERVRIQEQVCLA